MPESPVRTPEGARFTAANGSQRRIAALMLALFTLAVGLSLAYSLQRIHADTLERAAVEARTIFAINLAYRRWNASHGGVYTPVTERNPPNPYLIHPRRDVSVDEGRVLTLANPAVMTRQVHELLAADARLPIINKVTSLKFLNPANRPDAWEAQALRSFEQGSREAIEVVDLGGRPYLRLLRPYYTEEGCLTCHGSQGYRLGDVRGGLSIGIAMAPHLEVEARERRLAFALHLVFWLLGCAGVLLFTARLGRAERRVAESEWKFRTLAESSAAWEYWISERQELFYISPSAREVTGRAPEAFVANPELLLAVIEPEDRPAYVEHLREFRDHRGAPIRFRIRTPDGRVKWISHDCAPIVSEGRFLGRRVTNQDITAQQESETENRRLEAQLRQAQKMEAIGTLAGGIAHDFNNLLTAIFAYADLARLRAAQDAKLAGYLDQILHAGQRARDLVQQILTFSRKAEQRRVPLALAGVVAETMKLLRSTIPTTVEIRQQIDFRGRVLADETQMHQALMNLCTNAYHAMRESGGTISVSLRERELVGAGTVPGVDLPPGRYAVLEVSDTGTGMDAKTIEKIFEPYFTTKGKGEGTGLGLAVVDGIVRSHQGRIAVYSEPGRGSTFRIYLPVIAGETAQPAPPERQSAGEGGSERILLAEDEEPIRAAVGEYLGSRGYRVTGFANGAEALAAFERDPDAWDIVVTDMSMPGRNGKELALAVLALRPGFPVILCSGHSDLINGAEALKLGIRAYVPKPLSLAGLSREIRAELDRAPGPAPPAG